MGTPASVGNGNRVRGKAIRGITAEAPVGHHTPEQAERIASFARAMGWDVQSEWLTGGERVRLKVELGRMLFPGENQAAKYDRWIYRLIWEEIPEEAKGRSHNVKMRLVANRAITPTTGRWNEGPRLFVLQEMIGRHPKPVRRLETSVAPVKLKADPDKIG